MSTEKQNRSTEVADQLHSAAIHLLRKLRREDAASGLNAPRLSALSVVVFGGPLTLGDARRLMGSDAGHHPESHNSGLPSGERRCSI